MFAEDPSQLTNAAGINWTLILTIAGSVFTGISSAFVYAFREIKSWANAFLDRQDKFMTKLEQNDAKRIEILSNIAVDNAVKAKAIEAQADRLDDLTEDVKTLKTGMAILQDRLPCNREPGSSIFGKPDQPPGKSGN
jgi:hypothetical protein